MEGKQIDGVVQMTRASGLHCVPCSFLQPPGNTAITKAFPLFFLPNAVFSVAFCTGAAAVFHGALLKGVLYIKAIYV